MFKDLLSYIRELAGLALSKSKSLTGFDFPVTIVNLVISFLVANKIYKEDILQFFDEAHKIISGLAFLLLFAVAYFLIWFVLLGPFHLYRKYKPKKLPLLPVNIELSQRSSSGNVSEPDHSREKSYALVSSDFNAKTEVDFEIRHASVNKHGHATLSRFECSKRFSVSPMNEQGVCILNAKIKISQAERDNILGEYTYDPFDNPSGFIESMETGFCKEIVIKNIASNNVHELDFIFSKEGYEPLVIKYYVDLRGKLTQKKPSWWPEYDWKFPAW